MKLELNRKFVRKNHNDCDNHLISTNLANKKEVTLTKDFDLLTNELFDKRGFKNLTTELYVVEYKADIQKFNNIWDKHGTIHVLKPLNLKLWKNNMTISYN